MKSKSSTTKKISRGEIKKASVDWPTALKPLLKKYKNKKHPLEAKNNYQLLVMVVLSAQDSDRHINSIAPKFFETFPNMEALAKATPESLQPSIDGVRNSRNKGKWLIEMAEQIKKDS